MTSDAAGNPRATSVFFSYSREDQARAKPLIALIEAAGYPTWWDGLLEGGERYAHATEDALDRAQAVVVLWSKTSARSHWVHDEATRGRDRRVLVPLSLDGTPPPLGFGQFQVIDISKAKMIAGDHAMDRMIRAIAGLHNEPAPAVSVVTGARRDGPSRRILIGSGIALAVAGSGAAAWLGGLFGKAPVANSVAVLPFANLSDDPEQRYFSEGLASEIRAQLSRNALIKTAGLTSSNQFRDYAGDARSAARKLGVAFLLNGDVQKMGDQLKVSTFLVDGSTGTNIWSEVFEKQLSDVFSVQSEIAGAVTRQLTEAIDTQQSGGDKDQIGGTKSVAAFDAYLRGIDLFEMHIDEASERAALAKFDEAIAIDARYAAARAARSKVLAVIANQYAGSAERRALYAEAVAEAERATALAPDYAQAFVALGYAQFYGRLDARAARAPYDRAYALTRSEVDVISRYALYCARTGRFVDAEAAIARAAALDPLNSSMFKSAGNIKYAAGAYQEAIDFARQALALSPKRSTLRGDIGNAYLMLGQLDAAEAEFALESNALLALPGRAIIAQRRGQRAAVQERLAELVASKGDNSLYQQAQILAQSGAKDAAFAALDKAYAARDSGLVYLLNDPFLAPLRSDARYNNLLRQLKFV